MVRLTRRRIGWVALALGTMLAGCRGAPQLPAPANPSFAGVSLEIGALGDSSILSAVAPLVGEWEASRGGSVSVHQEPLAIDSITTMDVVLFSGERLGDLVDAGALAAIPNDQVMPPKPAEAATADDGGAPPPTPPTAAPEDTFQYMDFLPAFREQVSRYGTERLALPCGGSAVVLAFRRDAFESERNQAAARHAGLTLPPVTWNQLDAAARFFQGRDWDGDGQPDHGLVLALGPGAEGVGDAAFLARAAALGQHRDHFSFLFDSDTLTPRLDTPPFVEALAGVVAWKASGPPGVERFDSAAARASFRTGKVAMLIDRAEHAAAWSHGKPVSVAALPGSERVFEPVRKEWKASSPLNAPCYLPHGGGWLIGISSRVSGQQLQAAIDFAKYLTSPENGIRLRAERAFPLLPVRESQLDQGFPDATSAPDVDSRTWSLAVRQTLTAERVVPGLRIPGADLYLSDLAKGRAAALRGQDPETSLRAVAKAWADRGAALGPNRQLWHYRRSLNRLFTTPEPPQRGK
jgi:multiple sugar transport system substrate-binding protein